MGLIPRKLTSIIAKGGGHLKQRPKLINRLNELKCQLSKRQASVKMFLVFYSR